jgi:outer membrane protein TolC
MKHITILFIIILFSAGLHAQTIESVLEQVEQNNTTLAALRKQTDAEKIGNKTGIFPDNPEAEFHYLWGTPSAIGNRQDFNISQSIDFPTAYGYKSEISDISNQQAELQYIKNQKEILLETKLLLYDLIYLNTLKSELTKRAEHASTIANSYNARFEAGDANILEFNKAKINLLNAEKELEAVEVERLALLSELKGLNGGTFINFTDSTFSPANLPANFEQWYAVAEENNPVLSWLQQEIEKSSKQVKLERALSLPKFKGGYMSEKVMDEQFRGIAFGLSIPLWQDKNKVKYAKAKKEAVESEVFNTRLQFYNRLQTLYARAAGLQRNVIDYRTELEPLDHSNLLLKALDAGEITLIDYIMELTIYYESVNKLLELERDMKKSVARLNRYM